jgi:hypothetical protein
MKSKETVSTLSGQLLQSTVRNQRQSREHLRYEPTVVYYLAEKAKESGVELEQVEGPWRSGELALARPGRNSLHAIPIVTNERTEVMVDTAEHASDVAGLLNWCGIEDLDPVPELTPAAF